jgi:hypothetical protein
MSNNKPWKLVTDGVAHVTADRYNLAVVYIKIRGNTVNRRVFLHGAGASTAYVASRTFSGSKLYAQSSGLDPNLVNASITDSTTAVANSWNGLFSASDWANLAGAHVRMSADVQNKGLDSAFVDAAGQMGTLDPSVIDLQQLTNSIQIYQPSFQLSDMQSYFNIIPKDPTSLNSAMNGLKQGGLSGHLQSLKSQCLKMEGYAAALAMGSEGMQAQPKAQPLGQIPRQMYNCETDGAIVFALGTAMLVIGIMAGPAGVLALAFWGPLTFWGGIGVGAWGAGQVIAGCGF